MKRARYGTTTVALVVALIRLGAVAAQAPEMSRPTNPILDPNIVQAGCSTCGTVGCQNHPPYLPLDVGDGCGGPGCIPGRTQCCEPCHSYSMFGRIFCGIHDVFCCPDPCYEPRYIPAANAGFFLDSARPVSQVRIRWDAGRFGQTPDRGEFFWARIGGKGPGLVERGVDYHELSLVTEMAVNNFSIAISQPYRSLDPFVNDHSAGFGDLSIATKSLLLDNDIIQFALQFTTTIPTASAGKGFGTGHVSLEPALLATVKLTQETFFQAQLGEWIPIGGDPDFAGAMLNYRFSVNHVLARPKGDCQLIGTMEFGGYTFQDGLFTDPVTGLPTRASGTTYFGLGPGLRLVVCDKVDVGFGAMFGVSEFHFAEQLYRTEFRLRF